MNPYQPPNAKLGSATDTGTKEEGAVGRVTVSWGLRILACLLMLGGVLGIGLAFILAYQFLQVHWIYLFLVAGFMALFGWSALTGFRLWRGERRGWKWATILFALQVPVLTVPGLAYEYYTGLAIKLMGGKVGASFSLGLGANAKFYLDTRITDMVYGVNLFALGAVIYLVMKRPNRQLQPVASSGG
jgi:hypothetical protein